MYTFHKVCVGMYIFNVYHQKVYIIYTYIYNIYVYNKGLF